LALRHCESGEYLPYELTRADADLYQVPIIKPFVISDQQSNIGHVMSTIKEMNGIEGFVLRFNTTGMMYKIKSSWYVELHKTKTKSIWGGFSETDIWRAVLEGTVDDILAELNGVEVREEISSFNANVWKCMQTMADSISELMQELLTKFTSRKDLYSYLMDDTTCGKEEKHSKHFRFILT
jgi:hypothetical protein